MIEKPVIQYEVAGSTNIQVDETPTLERQNSLPSNDPNDPLNWPMWMKARWPPLVAFVSCLAALSGMNVAMINPAIVPLAKELHVSQVTASYQSTIAIAINGVTPFLYNPLANVYGRRPVYLATTMIGFASMLGASFVQSYGQLLAARVCGAFFSAGFVLGAVSVVDLFPYDQRGRAMGVFTIAMANAIFKACAIADGTLFVITLFCLPETLYIRVIPPSTPTRPSQPLTYLQRLRLSKPHPSLHLRAHDFLLPPLKMAKYPSVLFPALYYATQYGFASILPAVTVAHIWSKQYGWDVLQIGLTYGLALTIGGSLGELCAGMVVDYIAKRKKRACGGMEPSPECRLDAIWPGAILTPIGLLIYGFCIQYKTHWSGPVIGMGLAMFACQIITTTVYTYSIECYKRSGSDISLVINFFRQEIGMTFAFYVIRMGESIGYHYTFLTFALVGGVLAFLPVVALRWKGEEWRGRMSVDV